MRPTFACARPLIAVVPIERETVWVGANSRPRKAFRAVRLRGFNWDSPERLSVYFHPFYVVTPNCGSRSIHSRRCLAHTYRTALMCSSLASGATDITQSAGEPPIRGKINRAFLHLAVHARQLALQPEVCVLPRHSRSLLLRREHPRRAALDHYVHRAAKLGSLVMIREAWCKREPIQSVLKALS